MPTLNRKSRLGAQSFHALLTSPSTSPELVPTSVLREPRKILAARRGGGLYNYEVVHDAVESSMQSLTITGWDIAIS